MFFFTVIVGVSHEQHLIGRIFIKIVLLSFNIQSNFLLLFSLNSISTNYWPTRLDIVPVDCDVIIAIVATLFVPESGRVHQFVLDDIRVDAAVI